MSDKNEYIKLDPREHVLLKPSMYLGDTSIREEENYIFKDNKIVKEVINWSPALYKIFDEIIVNAYDQSIRDTSLSHIKVSIDKKYIQVKNDGIGIDISMHKIYKVYNPELIFGNLMTSSNFSQDEKRITGGTHGLGAKLTNIFSKKFEVIVRDKEKNLEYHQIFKDNMTIIEKPTIKKYDGNKGMVSIKFYPDFKRFGLTEISDDHIMLFTKRVYDLTGLTNKKIYLNEKQIDINSWSGYLKLYGDNFIPYSCNKYWSLGFKIEPNGYQISFVNGIFTNKNGKHMEHIIDQIYEKYSKSFKDISKKWIKNNFTIILKTSIINPSFNSQTKEELMTPISKFGITCVLDAKFYKLVDIEQIKELMKGSQLDTFAKTDGNKKSKIKGIPKLEDANYAGTQKSNECTLILTEGDSAKATAISGISSIKNGRNYFGVYPLRGKLLNVRDASMNQISNNMEISDLKKILGLKTGVVYNEKNLSSLRYGSIMLMMDADEDGSHIKGLVINFLYYFYPSLLQMDKFLKVLVTPVVKATKSNNILTFNNLSSYSAWKDNIDDLNKYKIKYYKGLGTSTSKEAGEYFSGLDKHLQYIKSDTKQHPHPQLDLAFKKKETDNRKEWLRQYNRDDRIEFIPNMEISIKDFVNLELKHFSNYDNIRSLPSIADGFKPSQRKVIYGCLKKNLNEEMKVAQLSGYIAEHTSYHHGENSLIMTIINLAQDFVGSNNINLLMPNGQFGSRLAGGKDHSSARYIFTQLNPIIRLIIRKEDNGLLEYLDDDGFKIEPKNYYPVIPLILVNGADGIGTGFSTFIPNYNIKDLIDIIMEKLDNKKPKKLEPYYHNHKTKIIKNGSDSYISKGVYEIKDNKLYISELPIKSWTTRYKEFLEELIYPTNEYFSSINNQSSEKDVMFILKIKDIEGIKKLINRVDTMGISDFERYLKLYDTFKISNMYVFNIDDDIKKYNSANKILDDFYEIRLQKYKERKEYLLKELEYELEYNNNKLKWLMMILNNEIDLRKLDNTDIIQLLKKKKISEKNGNYDYLLSISIREMTKDNVSKLKDKINKIKSEIKDLQNKTPSMLWKDDLNELKQYLGQH